MDRKGQPADAARFRAPARVNLLGEHTDYTGGYVLPMAIPFATEATIAPADDGLYHWSSDMLQEARCMRPDDRSARTGNWSDYPVGVLRELQKLGMDVPPFRLELKGDVPMGAGLSSSASVEVATALALLHHAGASLSGDEIALLCRRAENFYVGSPCGIMDQFVVANARAGHALLLHTRDLSYELLPMDRGGLAECVVIVANSGVRHSVAEGEYGVRRRELEMGQDVLRGRFPEVQDLGEATMEQLESCKSAMPGESFRRCRHVISENGRTLQARAAMLAGDPVRVGHIMTEAHASERDDFACSIDEVDFLVSTAIELPGCFGARLTGGGFGGCTVNLVRTAEATNFSQSLRAAYMGRWGREAAMYECAAVDGAVARASAVTKRVGI